MIAMVGAVALVATSPEPSASVELAQGECAISRYPLWLPANPRILERRLFLHGP